MCLSPSFSKAVTDTYVDHMLYLRQKQLMLLTTRFSAHQLHIVYKKAQSQNLYLALNSLFLKLIKQLKHYESQHKTRSCYRQGGTGHF